jgi:hypothetical protein
MMIAKQGGVCAICGKPETSVHQSGAVRRLAIDHNHETGQVRGLLCMDCNTFLGRTGDNIATLKKAIQYLKKYDKATQALQGQLAHQLTMF